MVKKITNKITKISKIKSEHDKEKAKERCISPEER